MLKKTLLGIILIAILQVSQVYSQNFNYDIKYHRLEFNVDPSVHYIHGKITTYFEPTALNFNEISFDMVNALLIDSIIYHNTNLTFSKAFDVLTIDLPGTIQPNTLDSIKVIYHGNPPTAGFGSFEIDTHNSSPIMWTLSEPYGAKAWWPCKQILTDKADSIDMLVTVPLGNRVAGNGIIVECDTLGDSLVTVHWQHRYPITAYLVAFAVTNYAQYYDYVPVNNFLTIPILEYIYPEDSSYVATQTPNIIDVFQFYCDKFMLYPFSKEKYGQAEFGWGGGMEHQTMTFLGGFDHELMAHELAHQWFGDYITCGSWHDIWVNEGFAVYLEGLTAEAGLAPYSWENWKAQTLSYATSGNSGSVYCDDTTSVDRIFNYRLTYMKGGYILNTLRWTVGDSAFFTGLHNYLVDTNLAYGFAKAENVKQHLENSCNCDLTEFFNDWYYGQGFPIYNFSWFQDQQNRLYITVHQSQTHSSVSFFEAKLPFVIHGDNADSSIWFLNLQNNQTYTIDLNFRVNNLSFDPQHWILTKNTTITQIDEFKNTTISVFPNPAKSKITVALPFEIKINSATIFDTNGRQCINNNFNINSKNLTIDISKLSKGTYILLIQTEKGFLKQTFIKNED